MKYKITKSPYNGYTQKIEFTIDESKNTSAIYSLKKEITATNEIPPIGEDEINTTQTEQITTIVDFDYETKENEKVTRKFVEKKYIDNDGVPFEIIQEMDIEDVASEIEMLRDLARSMK
ncbi:hypothetical protein KDN24_06035 [Bacillus sp. Bva_UNVM-123]|uniref:hypothetical protein n=1 Tax=Bacillus sp. Bva_UNVM-123 TaxID=2829798 RepID=UPI00391F6774